MAALKPALLAQDGPSGRWLAERRLGPRGARVRSLRCSASPCPDHPGATIAEWSATFGGPALAVEVAPPEAPCAERDATDREHDRRDDPSGVPDPQHRLPVVGCQRELADDIRQAEGRSDDAVEPHDYRQQGDSRPRGPASEDA